MGPGSADPAPDHQSRPQFSALGRLLEPGDSHRFPRARDMGLPAAAHGMWATRWRRSQRTRGRASPPGTRRTVPPTGRTDARRSAVSRRARRSKAARRGSPAHPPRARGGTRGDRSPDLRHSLRKDRSPSLPPRPHHSSRPRVGRKGIGVKGLAAPDWAPTERHRTGCEPWPPGRRGHAAVDKGISRVMDTRMAVCRRVAR